MVALSPDFYNNIRWRKFTRKWKIKILSTWKTLFFKNFFLVEIGNLLFSRSSNKESLEQ
jgi:hypothetical protein